MGMRDFAHMRLTDYVVNLTGKKINMYDEGSGVIYSFAPVNERIPDLPRTRDILSEVFHYIVDEDTLEELKLSGRPLTDIAFVFEQSAGRHGVEISQLKWANDPGIPVRLYHGLRTMNQYHL